MLNILCLGDSITAGTGSTSGNTYPECLKRHLKAYLGDVTVFNAGKPGYSTRQYFDFLDQAIGLPQTQEEMAFHRNKPFDAVVIMLGTNDCRKDNWVETPDSQQYLKGIAGIARELANGFSTRVFFCSVLPLADPMPKDILGGGHDWRQHRVEGEINPMIKRLAGEMGMSFVDVYSGFVEGLQRGENLYDGIHPFDSGYKLIAEIVGKSVCSMLTE